MLYVLYLLSKQRIKNNCYKKKIEELGNEQVGRLLVPTTRVPKRQPIAFGYKCSLLSDNGWNGWNKGSY